MMQNNIMLKGKSKIRRKFMEFQSAFTALMVIVTLVKVIQISNKLNEIKEKLDSK